MAHRVVMPTFGMYTVEATLSRWLVPAGAPVQAGDPIVEIEAEKASYEVEAPASGIVHPTAAEGAALTVEGLIGWILAEGEAPPGDAVVTPDVNVGAGLVPAREGEAPLPPALKASPAARKLAAEKGIDLSTLAGTGPGGRIVEADILAASRQAAPHPAAGLARKIRRHCVVMTGRANASHIGSSLSTADLLAVLYARFLRFDPQRPDWPERDRFILSKGHGCAALYAVLAECGYFPVERLDTFYQDGSPLAGHSTHKDVPGVEVSTGSLGHGLSLSAGMALAAKRDGEIRRVWCMLSDGECDEGSVWEAALFAPHHRLDNLVAIVDYNKIQSFGTVKAVLDLEPLGEKWRAFGWGVREIDGHDLGAIEEAYASVPFVPGRPSCIVAHTIKGKGVSYMEGKLLWHYRAPRGEDLETALREIDGESEGTP
ncbi:MAG: E3 binding domain-containing protein [Thermoanaerobaculia bacterium]